LRQRSSGAVGVNIGSRFLASEEAPIETFRQRGENARSQRYSAAAGTRGYGTVLRSLHTPIMSEATQRRDEARRKREHLYAEMQARADAGRRHEVLLAAGQTSEGVPPIPACGKS
jgi:NAD(P)H-dependent flavin oxidoreductase YrpB (nitropropane dioxygenase family)